MLSDCRSADETHQAIGILEDFAFLFAAFLKAVPHVLARVDGALGSKTKIG